MPFAITFVEVCLFGLALYLGFYLLRKKRDPRFPPGPPSLPIIGNVLQLGSQPQKVFIQWVEKYGNVFSFKMGTNDVIMINDSKTIKDVFAEASTAGRSPNPILVSLASGNYGIIIGEGAHWEQQRRFTLRTLRYAVNVQFIATAGSCFLPQDRLSLDLGFAKTSMEGIILEEINALCRFFEKRVNKPIAGYRLFNAPVVNVLWNIVSGDRHDWEGPENPKIMRYANDLVDGVNRTTETGLMYAPALRYFAPDYFGWTKWITSITNLNKICQQTIAEHAENLDADSPKDLIDHYLLEMQKTADPSSSFYKEVGDKNLNAVIPDLFLAGSETTSHTLSWLMIHLAYHQNVLKKVQAEIDNVVGPGRQPSTTDRPNTPYTEATINEILRKTSVVNNGVPHRMLQDAVINGHFFPKNATIISNIFRAHNDPKVWGDPENFRPERFLSSDGTKLLKNEHLIPFSSGRRICLGEALARDTLYLFLTCIVQKFDIKCGPGNNTAELIKNVEPKNKMINEPGSFEIIVNVRK